MGNDVSMMTAFRLRVRLTTSQKRSRRRRVAREAHGPGAVLDDEAGGGHGVRDADRADRQPVDLEGRSSGISTSFSTGVRSFGRQVKSGQVWLLKRWFFIDAITSADRVDAQREAGRAEVVVDQERQRAGVVEVRVGDEDVLDLHLLAQAERAGDQAGVQADGVVHEERRHPVFGDVSAVAAQDSKLHRSLPCKSLSLRGLRGNLAADRSTRFTSRSSEPRHDYTGRMRRPLPALAPRSRSCWLRPAPRPPRSTTTRPATGPTIDVSLDTLLQLPENYVDRAVRRAASST